MIQACKNIISYSFYLTSAIVIFPILSNAQQNEVQYNSYRVQEYFSNGIGTFPGFDARTLFLSNSPQGICSQLSIEVSRYYAWLSDESNFSASGSRDITWEHAPLVAERFEGDGNWYCSWSWTVTTENPPWETSVTNGESSDIITILCQKHGFTPLGGRDSPPYTNPGAYYDESRGGCWCRAPAIFDEATQWCYEPIVEEIPPNKDGCPANTTDNPCDVATGAKYRSESDVTSGAFTYTRSYNSQITTNLGLGVGWRGSYDKFLDIRFNDITVSRASGRSELFRRVNDQWVGDADSDVSLVYIQGSQPGSRFYELSFQDGREETYDYRGFLVKEVDSKGSELQITNGFRGAGYSFRQLRDQYGNVLQLYYENGLLIRVNAPGNIDYLYEHDANKNLVAVVYPDTTPDNDADNPRKVYHYENTDFPNHLTGITDENGDRYATFAYDENGKAISSELGQTTNTTGQQRVDLDYQGAQ